MEDMTVKREVARLISNLGHGGPADLARTLGVSAVAVSRWKRQTHTPDPSMWPGIEDYFGLPRGHLAELDLRGTPLREELDSIESTLRVLLQRVDEIRRLLG